MIKQYDVFLSYHGGMGDESRSSYSKAAELYAYLEARGISCFLYKKECEEDFYDAIDRALQGSRHFILVARDPEMLSEWVREEVKQFDGLRKNGKKPNSLISAYIFGSITEEDLYRFNSLFVTKDIACGEGGFERLYRLLRAKTDAAAEETSPTEAPVTVEKIAAPRKGTEEICRDFLSASLCGYAQFTDEEYLRHCTLLTERLKCMVTETISESCTNIIEEQYRRILSRLEAGAVPANLMRIAGQPGTQKSYVLQMLYICFRRHYDAHGLEPVYIHCERVRDVLARRGVGAKEYLEDLFAGIEIPAGRRPLFIVDGLLNIVIDGHRIDFVLKNLLDRYEGALRVVGVNDVFKDNPIRLNKSVLVKAKYEFYINLTPISLYDREKCLRYIKTLPDLADYDAREVYGLLNRSGLLTIDEFTISKIFEGYDGNGVPDIMDIFEDEIVNLLDGDKAELARGAAFLFDFSYGADEVDFSDSLHARMLQMICQARIYLNCLMSIYFCGELERYAVTGDMSFFNMVWPKEITRFITKKINAHSNLENTVVSMAERYHEMTPLGQSEISFFLGRIKTPNHRVRAIRLLNRYYEETKEIIKRRIIDDKYNGKPYLHDVYKQDLFLLRGISVSLIYCNDTQVLYEYLRSLIDMDLANSINRGFHLEYYGDKRYLPNQNMLDYEDNPRIGERTLRILCNSLEGTLREGRSNPAMLLELFTVVSLLQVRMEIDAKQISFRIRPYIYRCCELIEWLSAKQEIGDNVLRAFFRMAKEDFERYLKDEMSCYSPRRVLCNEYLAAPDVKRAGWVAQDIPGPESIVEHMYACFFIGLVFLPQTCPDIKDYDKQKILNMLLVHDLAETKLSDIPKYEKANYPDYDREENDTMLGLLLKGTYAGMGSLVDYVDAWSTWYERGDENARIAKDIDTIQAIYQFLLYYKKHPACFDEARAINWLREIYEVHTEQGQAILEELVLQNELFVEIFDAFAGKY